MHAKGFTLIELMIVVAIMALLVMMGMSLYSDYAIRARISEGIVVASTAQMSVAETRLSTGAFPNSNQAAGLPNLISSNYVSGVEVANQGEITVTFDPATVGIASTENTLTFVPTFGNNTVNWDCSGGTLLTQFRPEVCR